MRAQPCFELASSAATRRAATERRERRAAFFALALGAVLFVMLFFAFVAAEGVAYAATDAQDSVAADLADSVDAAIDGLDSDLFSDYIESLGEEVSAGDRQQAVGGELPYGFVLPGKVFDGQGVGFQ